MESIPHPIRTGMIILLARTTVHVSKELSQSQLDENEKADN